MQLRLVILVMMHGAQPQPLPAHVTVAHVHALDTCPSAQFLPRGCDEASEGWFPEMLSHEQSASARLRAAAMAFARKATTPGAEDSSGAKVLLHLYQASTLTELLNEVVLQHAEIPIYHVGVEVYGREWYFQYYASTWKDASVTGVRSCAPKEAIGCQYVKTIDLGHTALSENEVAVKLSRMRIHWPACSYHITRNNCIDFAEALVKQLGAPVQFPTWVRAVLDASANSPVSDALLDYTWSLSKKWMMHQEQRRVECQEVKGASLSPFFAPSLDSALKNWSCTHPQVAPM